MKVDDDTAQLQKDIERIERTTRAISICAWAVAVAIMIYGIPIVYRLLTHDDIPKQTAWILSLAVDVALAVGLIATPVLAAHGIKGGWVGWLRWISGFATWGLQTAEAWMGGQDKIGGPDWSAVFTHTVGPVMMFFAIEGAAYFQRKMGDVIARKRSEVEAADKTRKAEVDRRAEEIRKARTEAEAATRKRAEAEANFQAEAEARAEAEAELRAEVDRRKKAEAEVAAGAEARAEVERNLRAEVDRLTANAVAADARYRQTLDEAKATVRDARHEAAEQSDIASRIAGQLEESRLLAERAVTAKVNAEQELAAVTESREAVAAELHKIQQAYARLQQRAEAEGGSNRRRQAEVRGGSRGRKQAEVTASSGRKQTPELPPSLPVDLPPLDGVSPEVAARILVARNDNPEANRKQLAELVGVSDKTIRNVLNHPALTGSGSESNGHPSNLAKERI